MPQALENYSLASSYTAIIKVLSTITNWIDKGSSVIINYSGSMETHGNEIKVLYRYKWLTQS